MPVSFLTADQERRYGGYAGEPSSEQLARYFHLDDADRELVAAKRWDHMRLGYAAQLGTVRFLGTFLDDPTAVPAGVAADLARQLGVTDPRCLARYREGGVRWQHAREIRSRYGYREFTDPTAGFRLVRWLYALCWTGTDRPSVLFDRATAWLVAERVLLPGTSALERLVTETLDQIGVAGEDDDRTTSDPSHLLEAVIKAGPLMHEERRHAGIEMTVWKRQGFRNGVDRHGKIVWPLRSH